MPAYLTHFFYEFVTAARHPRSHRYGPPVHRRHCRPRPAPVNSCRVRCGGDLLRRADALYLRSASRACGAQDPDTVVPARKSLPLAMFLRLLVAIRTLALLSDCHMRRKRSFVHLAHRPCRNCRIGQRRCLRLSARRAQPLGVGLAVATCPRYRGHAQRGDFCVGSSNGFGSGLRLAGLCRLCARGRRRCSGIVWSRARAQPTSRRARCQGFGSQPCHLAMAYVCRSGRCRRCGHRDRSRRAGFELRLRTDLGNRVHGSLVFGLRRRRHMGERAQPHGNAEGRAGPTPVHDTGVSSRGPQFVGRDDRCWNRPHRLGSGPLGDVLLAHPRHAGTATATTRSVCPAAHRKRGRRYLRKCSTDLGFPVHGVDRCHRPDAHRYLCSRNCVRQTIIVNCTTTPDDGVGDQQWRRVRPCSGWSGPPSSTARPPCSAASPSCSTARAPPWSARTAPASRPC